MQLVNIGFGNIVAADKIVAIGFAMPFPAISGAEPPLGS